MRRGPNLGRNDFDRPETVTGFGAELRKCNGCFLCAFASIADDHHGDGRLALWIKSTADAQEDLVRMDPETFFVPPYVGPSGWVGMRLDRRPDWGMVAGLLEEGYRMVAPKRALKLLDDA